MSSKFSGICKKGFPGNFRRPWKILEGQPQKFIGWTRSFFPFTPVISGLLCVKFLGEGGWCNHFKFWKPKVLCYWIFVLLILQGVRFLSAAQRILFVLADFCLWKGYFTKWTALRNQIPPHLQPPFSPLSLIRV